MKRILSDSFVGMGYKKGPCSTTNWLTEMIKEWQAVLALGFVGPKQNDLLCGNTK